MTDEARPAPVPDECPRCGATLLGLSRKEYRDHIWYAHDDRPAARIWYQMRVVAVEAE